MSALDGAEDGAEGYFASVSDLMVGVLFVFLLMLTVFAINFREAETRQMVERVELERAKQEVEAARRDAETAARRADEKERLAEQRQREANVARDLLRRARDQLLQELNERQVARQRLLNDVEGRLRRDGVEVIVVRESGVLRLPAGQLFATGQTALAPSAARTVDLLAKALGEALPCFAKGAEGRAGCRPDDRSVLEGVFVEGHADRQPFAGGAQASRDRNDELATGRSLTVFRELLSRGGLDPLRNADGLPLVAVSAYGDRRPISRPFGELATEGDHARDRRIDLRFLLSSRTPDELKRLIEEIGPALGEAR